MRLNERAQPSKVFNFRPGRFGQQLGRACSNAGDGVADIMQHRAGHIGTAGLNSLGFPSYAERFIEKREFLGISHPEQLLAKDGRIFQFKRTPGSTASALRFTPCGERHSGV